MEQDNERVSSFFRFEDLRIYHKALDYIYWVYRATSTFPESEHFLLASSFNKAAQAIAINIAEGSARNKAQFIYYLKSAKTSVRECIVFTSIALQSGFISDETSEDSRMYLMELTKMIGALIASLQKSEREGRPSQDEEKELD